MAEVAQQPPAARSSGRGSRVIDHHRGIVTDPCSAHRRDERVRVGQRVPATVIRVVPAGSTPVVRRCRQFGAEVDELRIRDVTRLVTCSVTAVLEGPPYVQNHRAATHLEQTVQFGS